ncbi:hypothetical protein L3033_003077 [Providencia stuartii]|uniref:hypothetical protein n=1 Tax=Providencia TaxID=586 RepID=UPI0011239EF9|nr:MULTISPECIES: hypothetical protein [Providencia]MDN0019292.1 hypothetical protein [Providencia stuartii]HEM8879820.1 hypothetical protein [Providencia stuartii]
MKKASYQKELKAIKLLQERSSEISMTHELINTDLESIKAALSGLIDNQEVLNSPDFIKNKKKHLESMSGIGQLKDSSLEQIHSTAESNYKDRISLSDVLTEQDSFEINNKINLRVEAFNNQYGLDRWDYAIAGSCGLFAAMLDILCVKAPPKPTVKWEQEVDGVFNKWVQQAFNKIIPPDLSNALSKANPIGAPDSSTIADLVGAPPISINPLNHRLKSLAHDPILGFIFGVIDMLNGTCTVVTNGTIKSIPSTKPPTEGSVFQLLGRMLGHLLSDVNAPSAKGNRGMGLPAPFMGILRMFEGIPVGNSNFGKQIESMYVNGYDFRQFVVTSIPMTIMEVMLRAFYVIKQMKLYDRPFGESIMDTMPLKINPRFRIVLALAYGTSSSINAGKMYITKNILNANYASWLGLAWNGFHALKWVAFDRHLKLWDGISQREIDDMQQIIIDLDTLSERASRLPI